MGKETQQQQLPPLTMRAAFQPATVDRVKRTVDVLWSTGSRVLRGFWERYHEELSMDPKHVRMGRFESGRAPFCTNHNTWSVETVRGVVQSARLSKNQGTATVRFPREGIDPAADLLFEKIADGITPNVSIGYRVYRLEKVGEDAEKIPIMRATDWEPVELSGVAVGADEAAAFRTAEMQGTNAVEIINRGTSPQKAGSKMDRENDTQQTPEQIRAQERERITTISTLARKAGLGEDFARTLAARDVSLDEARTIILDELASRSDNDGTRQSPSGAADAPSYRSGSGHRITPASEQDDFTRAASDALVMRSGIKLAKPHAAAADLRHTSVLDMARTCLSRAGIRHGHMSPSEVVKRALSSDMFPQILADSIGKAIRAGYENEPSTHRLWVKKDEVPDFRDQLRPILGSAGSLSPVNELGEYTYMTLTEDAASFRVTKFGKMVSLSYELLKNDNVGGFLRIKPALGQAAARGEADAVYNLFKENGGAGPTMQDGVPLFHATHKNLTVAASMDAAGLGSARLLMRRQTALGGGQLSLVPRVLLVPPELETEAELLIAASSRISTRSMDVLSETEGDRPAWIGNLLLVVESRLDGEGGYYVLADHSQVDTVVLGLLDENTDGPTIEEEREFQRDCWTAKVRHVYAAKALDWRGMVKVPSP